MDIDKDMGMDIAINVDRHGHDRQRHNHRLRHDSHRQRHGHKQRHV